MILFSLIHVSCGFEVQGDQNKIETDLQQLGLGPVTSNKEDVGGSLLDETDYERFLTLPFSRAQKSTINSKLAESTYSESEPQITSEKPLLMLIYSPTCPYSRKVLDYLASIHKQIPLCNVRENRECVEKLIKQGGKALVPCLFIDDAPLYDTDTIIDWLKTHQDLLKNQ